MTRKGYCIPVNWPGVEIELTDGPEPVLRVFTGGKTTTLGPKDCLTSSPWVAGDDASACCGAELVLCWARLPGRTAAEIAAAGRFLARWPDYPGPQKPHAESEEDAAARKLIRTYGMALADIVWKHRPDLPGIIIEWPDLTREERAAITEIVGKSKGMRNGQQSRN